MRNEAAGHARIVRGSDESAQHQIDFGQHLASEKQACIAEGRIWREYVKNTLQISRERADELIRIGLGVITVETSRKMKRNSQRLSRKRNNLNHASKSKFMKYVEESNRISCQAKSRVARNEFSLEDKADMRAAVSDAIFSWQVLFDVLK